MQTRISQRQIRHLRNPLCHMTMTVTRINRQCVALQRIILQIELQIILLPLVQQAIPALRFHQHARNLIARIRFDSPDWTFVEQRSVLIQKGYQPPIHDFEIMTLNYEDITYDILESEETVTLAIIYDINQMDRKQFNKVLALYYNCPGKYYIVTGSGTDEIIAFAEELGLEEEEAWNLICTAV